MEPHLVGSGVVGQLKMVQPSVFNQSALMLGLYYNVLVTLQQEQISR